MNSFPEKIAGLPYDLQREIIRFLFTNWFGAKIKFQKFTGSFFDSNYCAKYLIGYVDGRKILNEQGLFLSMIRKSNGKHRYYVTKESNLCRSTYCQRYYSAHCIPNDYCGEPDRIFKSKAVGGQLLYALYQLYHTLLPFNF